MSDDPTQQLPGDADATMALSELAAMMRAMYTELKALSQKVDERLYDTRPLWEAVQTQIEGLQTQVETLQTQVTELRADMEKWFRRLDRKVEMLARTLTELYADERELEERVSKLEEKAS